MGIAYSRIVNPKNPETGVFCCLPGILYKLVHECGPSMHCFADTAKWRGRKQRLYIVGWSWAAAYKLLFLICRQNMMNLTHCQYWAQVEIQSLYLFQMLIFPYRYLIFTNIIVTYCLGPGCSPFFTFLLPLVLLFLLFHFLPPVQSFPCPHYPPLALRGWVVQSRVKITQGQCKISIQI